MINASEPNTPQRRPQARPTAKRWKYRTARPSRPERRTPPEPMNRDKQAKPPDTVAPHWNIAGKPPHPAQNLARHLSRPIVRNSTAETAAGTPAKLTG